MMRVSFDKSFGASVEAAVIDKLYPNAYSYEGQLEKLQQHIELQSSLIAKLVESLCENGHVKTDQLQNILGCSYEVRLD